MPRPRIQFTTEPSVLPAVAATKSNTGSLRPEVSRPRSTSSDETGSRVAARNALANREP